MGPIPLSLCVSWQWQNNYSHGSEEVWRVAKARRIRNYFLLLCQTVLMWSRGGADDSQGVVSLQCFRKEVKVNTEKYQAAI